MKRVLDVGSSNVKLDGMTRFAGWNVETYDRDPEARATYTGDVLNIGVAMNGERFDAVYASHILEHLPAWETVNVLRQFTGLLGVGAWLEVWVPNAMEAMAYVHNRGLGMADTLYEARNGSPVTLLDILYGWEREVRNGKRGFAHLTAFDWPLLADRLREAGYFNIQPVDRGNAFEIGYCAWFGRKPGWLEQ